MADGAGKIPGVARKSPAYGKQILQETEQCYRMEKGWKTDLQMELANLPRQEKKAARYLLEQEEQIETMTLRQCAAGAGI